MKVLVTAASGPGSTPEIASVIATALRTAEVEAYVGSQGSVLSALDGFDALILVSGTQLSVFEWSVSKVVHADGDLGPPNDVAGWAREIGRLLKGASATPLGAVDRRADAAA